MSDQALQEHANQVNEAVSCLVQAMGMMAENEQRKIEGASPAYRQEAFENLVNDHGLDHNGRVLKMRNFF